MTVLIIEPGQSPRVTDIPSGLRTLQEIVNGPIEVAYPFCEPVALVCHAEGKLLGLMPNRVLRNTDGMIIDYIAGTFLLANAEEEELQSLSPEQVERYRDVFKVPDCFIGINGELFI